MKPAAFKNLSAREKRLLLARLKRREAFVEQPLSHGQRALWFLHQLAPQSDAYNTAFALAIHSPLDREALRRALAALLERHTSLRATFAERAGEPVQRLARQPRLHFEEIDAGGDSERDFERRLEEIYRRPFDLENGPVTRFHLFRRPAGEHVLLLAVHHVVFDFWSFGVVLDELAELYAAYAAAREPVLPAAAAEYGDYVRWQREMLVGGEGERLWSWWRRQLGGELPVLDLPLDRPRPPARQWRGTAHPFTIPSGLGRELRAFARERGLTLYSVLLGAFAALLGRYSGQPEALIGSPTAGRSRGEFEALVGYLVNPVVIRARLGAGEDGGEPSFDQLVRRISETALDAIEHQDYPFPLLVERLQPERDPSASPLFQVMFALETPYRIKSISVLGTGERTELGGLEVSFLDTGRQQEAQFDLSLIVVEQPGGLVATFFYDVDLFDATTVARMARHYTRFLTEAVSDASRRAASLPLLDAASRHQLTTAWNDTAGGGDVGLTLPARFEHQAAATPAAPALEFGATRLTYGELNARANRLAHRLLALGLGPEAPVGLFLERSAAFVESVLAVVKAGGAYVPLSTSYPSERLRFMIEDTGIEVLLTQASLADRLEDGGPPTLCLDGADADAIAVAPADDPAPRGHANQLAYVIYTSGSTGRPKGIRVPQRAVERLVVDPDYTRFRPDDRIAQISNAAFDAATYEIWGALLNGACLVGFERDVTLDPPRFAAALATERIDGLFVTTALFNQMARLVPDGFSAVREVLTGGEAVDPRAMAAVLEAGPPRHLQHVYGPTENTTFSSFYPVRKVPAGASTLPIGRPIRASTMYVVDASFEPVPIGVPGELVVGGEGLARDYQERPALTAERFVPHPFSAEPGERLYRTGDLVRFKTDGAVEFLGRFDHQVKIRGFRIELGEIEAVLARQPGIRSLLVTVHEDADDRRLVAYFVGEASAAESRAFLADQLPDYMVPSAFVRLEAFPLTPNGKIDRKALPDPAAAVEAAAAAAAERPRTPIEEGLAWIWAEVLGRPWVGLDENFFELGGHSLLATRVVARARRTFGVELPLQALFTAPTVVNLAAAVERELGTDRARALPPIEPLPRADGVPTGELPLSFSQQRLWFLEQLEPGGAAYTVPGLLRLRGHLDTAALAGSLDDLARRHESLRTRFAITSEGQPLQCVAPVAGRELPVIDLRALPAALVEAEAGRLAAEIAAQDFDLGRGPLLRSLLLRLAEDVHHLVLALHHIISDGWSLGILLGELTACYEARLAGTSADLPVLPIQYPDFAAWQRRVMAGEVLAAELEHWRRRLDGAPFVLDLPTDRPRPAVQSFVGAGFDFTVPAAVRSAFGELGRQTDTTLFMGLAALFQILLRRVSGQDDFLLGTPIANRDRREIERLIGFFVNTLVLRADLRGNPTAADLLGRTRRGMLEAFGHAHMPFERLVEELQPERDLGYAPLCQVVFALQNAPVETRSLPGLELEMGLVQLPVARFDLECHLWEEGDVLRGRMIYSTALFDATTVSRLARNYVRLLTAAADGANRRVSALPLLDAASRHQLTAAWNDTAPAGEKGLTLAARFERQAAATPAKPALDFGATRLTYGELNARANRLAHRLLASGLGPEAPVGLFLERSAAFIESVLAVVKAGGVYVPLSTSYPPERLRFMIEDTGIEVLLTQAALADRLEPGRTPILCLDGEGAATIATAPAENPPPRGHARQLAYVIYTSGSTGRPKGIRVPHRAVERLVIDPDYTRFRPDDRIAQISNAAFDAATYEIWGALLNGACLVGFERDVTLDPPRFAAALAAERIDGLFVTTALFNQMARQAPDGFSAVREVLTGGEAVDPRAMAAVLEAGPPEHLQHVYGPTENTTFSSFHPVREVPAGASTLPIGRPIRASTMYVVDAGFEPVPIGVSGELLVGGEGLARDYQERPALTAERFVPHPFSDEPGERLYRTGDLVRFRPEGTVEFLGRFDHQVKIRGFRIELGEIEAVLARHPGVRSLLVTVHGDAGDRRLVAYFVSAPGTSAGELRAYLAERLPEYMVPSAFVQLETFPLTPNGKIDRKALPDPVSAADGPDEARPRTPFEEGLLWIWAEVLNRPRVGLDEDFFESGGHSLLATQVMSRLRRTFGVELPLQALFAAPTVAGLAAAVERELGSAAAAEIPPIEPRQWDGAEPLPLSHAQQRLWFLAQLEPEDRSYNVPVALELAGRLDVDALSAALAAIVRRHEVLRTTFGEDEGTPYQVIAAPAEEPPELPCLDLTALPPAARERRIRELRHVEAMRPFDLERGPLFCPLLLCVAADRHVLLLSMHHVVTDGWSIGVLLRELTAFYGAERRGEAVALPPLAVQYADFALWQRRELGELFERQLAWWREALAGAPAVIELPTDRPRAAGVSPHGADLELALGPALSAAVDGCSRQHAVTPFMLLLAAWGAVLARHAAQDEVVVGSPVANRNRVETEGLIGFFINSLALRLDLRGKSDRSDLPALLEHMRAVTLGAYAHQDLPFEHLVEALEPERRLETSPLFQVMFVLQNAPLPPFELDDITLTPLPYEGGTTKYDLTLTLFPWETGYQGSLRYRTAFFDATTAERLRRHFENFLRGLVEHPERPLAEQSMLSPGEAQQVLREWSRGEIPEDGGHETFLERFDARVAWAPEAVAVVGAGSELRYGELDARARGLARELVRLGVGPDVPVALGLERSSEMIVAILGCLRAGGAFLPLDASLPPERTSYMVADAGASVLVTRSGLLERFAPNGSKVVELDALHPWGDQGGTPEPGVENEFPASRRAGPRNLAYVIYTSGSTGRPKGVGIEHRQLLAYTEAMLAGLALDGPASFAMVSTPAADLGHTPIFGALASGGAVHLIEQARLTDPDAFGEDCAARGIDCLKIVPSHLAALLTGRQPARVLPKKKLVLGGEAVEERLVARVRELASGLDIVNEYGPTEVTVGCATYVLPGGVGPRTVFPPLDPPKGTLPLGRPMAGNRALVLDAALRPVPPGVAAELCLGGGQVGRGYLGRPGLTAERFVPDPCGEAGERLYRTGDRALFGRGGELEFLGRLDHQVKLRGYRIEPGEIEAVLAAHPVLAAAVVQPWNDDRGEPRLVSYLVAVAGREVPPRRDLVAHLALSLPDYMVPAAFVTLDALPLNANGKLDRRALPVPVLAEPTADAPEVPLDPLEEMLAGFWKEFLGCERVGGESHFFHLGGHSLLATRLISRIRRELDCELPLRVLFEAPTLSGLAARIRALQGAGDQHAGDSLPPIEPVPADEPAVLSFAQERFWFLDQLDPGASTYNVPHFLELKGELDTAALERALAALVERHAALRTVFARGEHGPVQIVGPVRSALPVIDLSSAADAESRLRQLARDEARQPFDLAAGPLLRTTLVRRRAGDHVLFMTFHHIVSDAWSGRLVERDLARLYAAEIGAGTPPPAPALGYADFAAWQRRVLTGERRERLLGWWRERLAGLAELDLPADRPRPTTRSGRGALREVALSPELRKALEALGRSRGMTPFITFLAGFTALLARLTGIDDVAVGTPVAHRGRPELEGVVGVFLNTLVLRVDLAGRPSFEALLERVRETTLAAYEHQDLPFEVLVDALDARRDLSRTPLVTVVLSHDKTPLDPIRLPGLEMAPYTADSGNAKFDLSLGFLETGTELLGALEYSVDLFEATTVERWWRQFSALLTAAAKAPASRLEDLPLLRAAERQQLVEWNAGAIPPGLDAPDLAAAFEARAERDPGAIAVEYGDEHLSFGRLAAWTAQLAHELRRRGIGPERRVALCLRPSLEMAVAVVACWRSGGVYVPLDPAAPAERLRFILGDCAAELVLTTTELRARLPADAPPVLCLEPATGEPEGKAPAAGLRPQNAAYVIYTSGSTGRPKGVAISHAAVLALARSLDAAIYRRLGQPTRVALNAPLVFDASVQQWVQLLYGRTLHLLADELRLEPAALCDYLRRHRLEVLDITPTHLRTLLDAGLTEGEHPTAVIVGGEAIDAPMWGRLADPAGPAFFNVYGPTESTVDVTCHRVEDGDERPHLGRPLAHCRAYVLDESLRPLPLGAAGELGLAGPGLALGYPGRGALTAGRFVPDALGGPGERLYRTGDRARFLADGRLEFLGRLDHQVKLRGYRIELGEIEEVLGRHPMVQTAVANTWRHPGHESGDVSLVAYVLPREPSADLGADQLEELAREFLPGYMVPASFVVLDELPLLTSGKVDRKSLPAPPEPAAADAVARAPRGPLEEVVAGIWAEVLGRDEAIGIDEDFFALGGHSLLATQVSARLYRALGIEVPVRLVFEAPTVVRLAARLEEIRAVTSGEAATAPIRPLPRSARLPLSFAQERLWFLDRFEPGTTALNMPVQARLRGRLDIAVLTAAFGEIVGRHEILRTTFEAVDGEPFQRVAPSGGVTPCLIDLSGLEPAARQRAAEGCRRRATLPFDLERGPLLRVVLVRLAADETLLLFDQHHIIADGWSTQLLFDELARSYEALAEGRPLPLAPLPVQYADYAAWQRRHLAAKLDAQLAYWRERLAGAPPLLELPLDRPRPAVQAFRGAVVTHTVPAAPAQELRQLSRRESATLFMTLLTAFKILLGRLSQQTDIVVGTPIAGRLRPEVEELLGCFLNSLVLRTDLDGDPSFRELLARVRETAFDAYAHQEIPFERLLEDLVPERDLSHTPLFQVFFNMLNMPLAPRQLPGLVLELLEQPTAESKFDLTVYASEHGAEIVLYLVYNAELFDRSRIEEMVAQYGLLLEQAAERPEAAVGSFTLGTAAAERVLPDPTAPLAHTWRGPVQEIFAAWAEKTPEAPAVIDRDGILSYAELDNLANHLAANLAAVGVGRGDAVVILGQRTAALVWAILGTLKAGAAFVILDPAYPAPRLAEMLGRVRPRAFVEVAPRRNELPAELAAKLDELGDLKRVALSERAAWPTAPMADPGVGVGPDDLAYVAFTSGSTGRAKGILGRHGSLTHFTPWQQETYGLGPSDRFSLLSGLAHDPLQRDVFTPLQVGAAVVIPDPASMFRAGYLARWMEREKITVANLTPAMAQMVSEADGAAGEAPELTALRYVFLVGDVLTRRDVARLVALAPNVECVNHYGSTETQRAVGYHRMTAADAAGDERTAAQVLPLGRGIPGVQLLVCSSSGRLAGLGEVGEIYVRSPHLACGYLDEDEDTAARFVANPFTGAAADRVYKTGDLGRYLPNGEVTFAGRADQQVKLRGFRIELGEIEATLGRHPAVADCVVMLRRDGAAGEAQLVAYAVATAGHELDVAELRSHLARQLPQFMVPAAFLVLDALPLTPNGKVDRRALPAVEQRAAAAYAPPQSELEEKLVALWQTLLKVDKVGIDDNFFDLGGHSLLLVRLNSRLEELLGRQVPLMDLFSHPNIRSLVEHLERRGAPAEAGLAQAQDLGRRQSEALRRQRKRRRPRPRRP